LDSLLIEELGSHCQDPLAYLAHGIHPPRLKVYRTVGLISREMDTGNLGQLVFGLQRYLWMLGLTELFALLIANR